MRWIGREGDLEELNMAALKIARDIANDTGTLMAGDLSNTQAYLPENLEAIEKTQLMFKVCHLEILSFKFYGVFQKWMTVRLGSDLTELRLRTSEYFHLYVLTMHLSISFDISTKLTRKSEFPLSAEVKFHIFMIFLLLMSP